jgi:hypothetical protein
MTREIPRPASDVFTLGMMLYQLLGQGHPYIFDDAEKYLPAYRAYSAARPKLKGTPKAPASAESIENVLYQCLNPDPAQRPTAADLHRALTGEPVSLSFTPPSAPPVARTTPRTDTGAPGEDEETKKPAEAEAKRKEIERLKEEARKRDEAERKKHVTPTRLILTSAEGVEQAVGARVVLGRIVLSKFGEAAKYASNEQYILDRVDNAWYVEACPGTANDTLLNGELLEGGTRAMLSTGDVIAVGKAARKKSVLDLTVRYE